VYTPPLSRPLLASKLKTYLNCESFYSTAEQRPVIYNCKLIIAGGDVNKVAKIHEALSLLNVINFNNKIFTDDDADVSYLCNALLNKVIILKCIYKVSYGKQKKTINIHIFFWFYDYFIATTSKKDNDTVSMFVRFCCITENLLIGRKWFGD